MLNNKIGSNLLIILVLTYVLPCEICALDSEETYSNLKNKLMDNFLATNTETDQNLQEIR